MRESVREMVNRSCAKIGGQGVSVVQAAQRGEPSSLAAATGAEGWAGGLLA